MSKRAMNLLAFPQISIKGREVEYKSFRFRVKSVDEDQGRITGYLSTFGNVDLQKDRVVAGAFKKTLTEAYARKANGRAYLFAILWMHDPEQPIGGFIEAQEDSEGLLVTAQLDISTNAAGFPNNPIATMVFSGFKAGYIDEMSMGYLAIQKEYEAGVRNLKEVALLEGSAITMLMAANPEALVPASGVKSMHAKGASGKTTWPLAPRETKWDSGEATKAIEEWADGDWSKVAQCFFWVAQSPPEKLDDCKLPFVAKVGEKMMAIPEGIIACAGVLQGAMGGADLPSEDEDAVKAKVASYYKKMDMTPPWEDESDSGKRSTMKPQRKDFNEVHAAGKAADCLENFCDLLNDLTKTMFQVFGMGDSPESDMADCLKQFGDALTEEWLPKAVDSDLGQYLNDRGYCNDASAIWVPGSMQVGGSSYGYMSRRDQAARKGGRVISAATQEKLEQHQADMKALMDDHTNQSNELASQFKSMVKDHMSAMQQKVADLTDLWADEGQGPAYTNDDPPDVTDHSKDDGKARFTPRREPAHTPLPRAAQPQAADTASEETTIDDLEALLA
jgi:HK97 family phage prohead protease